MFNLPWHLTSSGWNSTFLEGWLISPNLNRSTSPRRGNKTYWVFQIVVKSFTIQPTNSREVCPRLVSKGIWIRNRYSTPNTAMIFCPKNNDLKPTDSTYIGKSINWLFYQNLYHRKLFLGELFSQELILAHSCVRKQNKRKYTHTKSNNNNKQINKHN